MNSPYLKPNRLADVIAALQSMAFHQRSSLTPEFWADRISGDKAKGAYWESVFVEHPEFFRRAPDSDRFALVWRRALPRRFDRKLNRPLSNEEYETCSEEKKESLSRLPISETQVKTLIDTAIALYSRSWEQSRDYRWWVIPLITILSAAVGSIIGARIK